MDFVSGIDPLYRAGRMDFSLPSRSAAEKEVANEFLNLFLNEILKETFTDEEMAANSSRLSLMREVVLEKLSADLLESDAFGFREILPGEGVQ